MLGLRSVRRGSFVLAVAVAVLPSACSWGSVGGMVVGSGAVTTETRAVADFTEVEARSGIQLELANGPRQVQVTAQPNILDITTAEASGSRLTLDTTSGYVTPSGLVVKVTAPGLTWIELSGGASATGTAGTSEKLAIEMSGGARATLSGSTTNLDLGASGGAIPDLSDVRATNATVDLSGGVVATVTVSGSLKGSASGGVVLTLTSPPASTDVATSGGAVVRNR
jgi:hypothetical protein